MVSLLGVVYRTLIGLMALYSLIRMLQILQSQQLKCPKASGTRVSSLEVQVFFSQISKAWA